MNADDNAAKALALLAIVVVAALVLLLVGCGGENPAAPDPSQMHGAWSGTTFCETPTGWRRDTITLAVEAGGHALRWAGEAPRSTSIAIADPRVNGHATFSAGTYDLDLERTGDKVVGLISGPGRIGSVYMERIALDRKTMIGSVLIVEPHGGGRK